MNKYILLTIITFFINNIIIWYQLNGQLVWDFWKSPKGIITNIAIPILNVVGSLNASFAARASPIPGSKSGTSLSSCISPRKRLASP